MPKTQPHRYVEFVTLDQLLYFVETARHEHVGKASRQLNISPSAISHSISALEAELGHKLFEKRGKNIVLTRHGRLLQSRAQELMRTVKNLKEELSAPNLEWEGHLRIAATHVFSSEIVAQAASELQHQHNKVTVDLYSLKSADVVAGVLAGAYDLGVCISPQRNPELESRVLHTGNLSLAVRSGHPVLRLPKGKRIAALQKLGSVMPKAFQGIEVCETHPALKKMGLVPKITFAYDSYDVAVGKLRHSSAWAFVPDWLVRKRRGLDFVLRPDHSDPKYTIEAIWKKSNYISQTELRLIELVSLSFK